MIFIIIGVAIGSFITVKHDISGSIWVTQGFMSVAEDVSVYAVIKRDFLSLIFFVSAAFLLGMSAVGQPVGFAMLIYRGIGIGASSATVYALLGKRGLMHIAVLILPKALAFSAVSILAVRELIRSSNLLFGFVFKRDIRDDNRNSIRLYAIKFLVLIIMSLLISAADGGAVYLYSAVGRQ
jgi:hypothetical protein